MPSTMTFDIVGLLSNGINPIQNDIVTTTVAITAGSPYSLNPVNAHLNSKPKYQSLMKSFLQLQQTVKANKKLIIKVI